MIFANFKDVDLYRGANVYLDKALDCLNDEFLKAVPYEPFEIDGRNVYCFKVDLNTKPEEETFFENHEKYGDIHVVVAGAEGLDMADPAGLELYESHPENDAFFFHGTGNSHVTLTPGNFLVVYPNDAHKTCMMVGDEVKALTKVVFKFLIK